MDAPSFSDVAVVGAGHNGLVLSFYLARAGKNVTVFERRSMVGGACVTEELLPATRFSTCASVLWQLQAKVEDDLELHRHGLRYDHVPGVVALFPDHHRLVLSQNWETLRAEVCRLSPSDGERLPDWHRFWLRAASLLHPFSLREAPTMDEIRKHAQREGNEEILDKLLACSTQDICDDFFEDERVKASLVTVEDVGAWVPGSALVEAWSHTNVFNRARFAFPRSGMGAVTQAMARAAEEAGVHIVTESEVVAIISDAGRITGIRLADGRKVEAQVVVSNADPKRTMSLVTAGDHDAAQRFSALGEWSTTVSYQKFHGILEELPDLSQYFEEGQPSKENLASIRITPSLQVYREAFEAAQAGELPRVPAVGGMFIPTVFDPALAPSGQHTVSAWILYAPAKLANGSWEAARKEAGRRFIARVGEFIPNFESSLVEWIMMLPPDIAERHYMTDGNIRHLDVRPGQFLSDRPAPGWGYRSPIKGLYLCGAGTHPGGEVTGSNGFNAARAIIDDWIAEANTLPADMPVDQKRQATSG